MLLADDEIHESLHTTNVIRAQHKKARATLEVARAFSLALLNPSNAIPAGLRQILLSQPPYHLLNNYSVLLLNRTLQLSPLRKPSDVTA